VPWPLPAAGLFPTSGQASGKRFKEKDAHQLDSIRRKLEGDQSLTSAAPPFSVPSQASRHENEGKAYYEPVSENPERSFFKSYATQPRQPDGQNRGDPEVEEIHRVQE